MRRDLEHVPFSFWRCPLNYNSLTHLFLRLSKTPADYIRHKTLFVFSFLKFKAPSLEGIVIWSENQNFYVTPNFRSHWNNSIWGYCSFLLLHGSSFPVWVTEMLEAKKRSWSPRKYNYFKKQPWNECIKKKGIHWDIM